MNGRVIVVGSVNVDLVVVGARLPGPGETVTGGQFERHQGGKGGNQAVAAARLGAATSFIGAVGDDEFGTEARAALAAEGIDITELTTIGGASTGVAVILVGERGENIISVAGGANGALVPETVRAALSRLGPAPGDVVLVGHEIATPTAREALRVAAAAGARTILNPAPADGLDRSTLGLADVITPNRSELAILAGVEASRRGRAGSPADDPVRAAHMLLEQSPEGPAVKVAIIVTLGGAGAVLVRHAGPAVDLPAPAVATVDTTGAGDAFNGALAAGLAAGMALEAAAERAIRAAALSTRSAGAREGMPTAAELDSPG